MRLIVPRKALTHEMEGFRVPLKSDRPFLIWESRRDSFQPYFYRRLILLVPSPFVLAPRRFQFCGPKLSHYGSRERGTNGGGDSNPPTLESYALSNMREGEKELYGLEWGHEFKTG